MNVSYSWQLVYFYTLSFWLYLPFIGLISIHEVRLSHEGDIVVKWRRQVKEEYLSPEAMKTCLQVNMSKVDGLELSLLNISSKQQKPNMGWQLYLGQEAHRDLGLVEAVEGENTKHRSMSLQLLSEDIITPVNI